MVVSNLKNRLHLHPTKILRRSFITLFSFTGASGVEGQGSYDNVLIQDIINPISNPKAVIRHFRREYSNSMILSSTSPSFVFGYKVHNFPQYWHVPCSCHLYNADQELSTLLFILPQYGQTANNSWFGPLSALLIFYSSSFIDSRTASAALQMASEGVLA